MCLDVSLAKLKGSHPLSLSFERTDENRQLTEPYLEFFVTAPLKKHHVTSPCCISLYMFAICCHAFLGDISQFHAIPNPKPSIRRTSAASPLARRRSFRCWCGRAMRGIPGTGGDKSRPSRGLLLTVFSTGGLMDVHDC